MKKMGMKELVDTGLLQEINRQVLHPVGCALSVMIPDENEPETEELKGSIIDCRDDPEGFAFGDDYPLQEKAERVRNMMAEKAKTRLPKLGFVIQPASPPVDVSKVNWRKWNRETPITPSADRAVDFPQTEEEIHKLYGLYLLPGNEQDTWYIRDDHYGAETRAADEFRGVMIRYKIVARLVLDGLVLQHLKISGKP